LVNGKPLTVIITLGIYYTIYNNLIMTNASVLKILGVSAQETGEGGTAFMSAINTDTK